MDAKEDDRLYWPETAAAYERREDDNMGLLVPRPNICDDVENEPGSPIVIEVEIADGDPNPLELK